MVKGKMGYEGIYDIANQKIVGEFLTGRKVKLKSDLEAGDRCSQYCVGVDYTMERFAGEVVTINSVMGTHANVFEINEDNGTYKWSFGMIDYILADEFEMKPLELKVNIKKGDLVKFISKTKSKTEEVKKIDDFYGIPVLTAPPIEAPKETRKKFVVCDIVGDKILPYFLDGKYNETPITTSMVEVVEENYIENTINQVEGIKIDEKRRKAIEDIKLMEEMKSKVNIKDFKKIYAGAMGRIPNELKGVELLLNEWAFNKKEIYKMLGNKFSITKEVEAQKDEGLIETNRQELYRKFPGAYYVLNCVNNSELLKNKLEHEVRADWIRYAPKRYTAGDKVSKMIDEAFSSDKLNIALSDIIAQGKVRGIVEVSIDPIEYLLMSCNVSGWSSCHTIYRDSKRSYGCYSAGIFSYMCDNVSLIAFRHDGKLYDYKIENQKVQAKSKNWRQMVWLSPKMDCFITSRQYPNKIEELTKTVREILEEQLDLKDDNKTWVHSSDQSKLRQSIGDKNARMCPLHYNDMLHGYNGDLCYKKAKKIEVKEIEVGSHPVCPNCGEKILKTNSYPECSSCHNDR